MGKPSLSRQFARWAANLQYRDLPPAVADKARALLLHALAGAALGATRTRSQSTAAHVLKEESRPDGATVLALSGNAGGRATRAGAAYANAELIAESGLVDSYRMLTHPGPILISAALANAELEGRSGAELLAALAAGYEFTLRLCHDFIPATAARGFRPNPIYCSMGAALASGKLLGQDEDALVATIALAANFASGLFESALSGGGSLNTPQAARNGVQAALIAGEGHVKGTEQVLEGRAGFYNAFIGNYLGDLAYSFEGATRADPLDITSDLGTNWKLLTVMQRMYATSGYNQPVIDLIAEMKRQHRLDAGDMQDVSVKMNWMETLYPSPAYPRKADWDRPGTGTTHFYAAHAAVHGGYPVVGGDGPGSGKPKEDSRVLDFMNRHVHLLPEKDRALFSPAVVITLKDGRRFEGEYPYRRMALNFEQLVAQLQRCLPGYPGGRAALDGLVSAVRAAEQHASVAPLIQATLRPA